MRDNFVVAAFEERGCCAEDVYERLDYDSKYGYFNAGVLLVNLDYWRTHNMTQAFIEYIEHNFEKLRAHDQDVLNAFFYDKSVHISLAWNVEFIFYYYGIIKKFDFKASENSAFYLEAKTLGNFLPTSFSNKLLSLFEKDKKESAFF